MRTLFALLAALLPAVLPPSAAARDELGGGSTYITPFPEGDIYRLLVIGDSLAEGLLGGLLEEFGRDGRLQINNKHRTLQGLARSEFDNDVAALGEAVGREPLHIAVVLVGVYDRAPLRNAAGRRVPIGSEDWKSLYGQRVDQVIKSLKKRDAAIYWVGLPVMRRPEANDDAELKNDVFRDRALSNGIKYIDVYAGTADESGNYNAYGPDVSGKSVLLRAPDGTHFTRDGNRKLAHFVEREIKRDLTEAKKGRTIELAGSEAEQQRIKAAVRAAAPPAAPRGWGSTVVPEPKSGQETKTAPSPVSSSSGAASAAGGTAASSSGSGEQRADNTRVTLKTAGVGGREEAVIVEIVRPAIPASVIALVQRRESADRATPMGDTVTDSLPGGLTVLSSITPTGAGPGGMRRRLAPTQAPYFRVLIKGERPTPKPGRLDDFSWPRPEPAAADTQPPAPSRPARPGTRQYQPKPPGPKW